MAAPAKADIDFCRRPHVEPEYGCLAWCAAWHDGMAVLIDHNDKIWYVESEPLATGTRCVIHVDTCMTTNPADDWVSEMVIDFIPDPEDGQAARQFNYLRYELFGEEEHKMW